MTDLKTLIRLHEVKLEQIRTIADFNLKAAETRKTIEEALQVRVQSAIYREYMRALRFANIEHERTMKRISRERVKLNRGRDQHIRMSRTLLSYSAGVFLSAMEISHLWASFKFLGMKSMLLEPIMALDEVFPKNARHSTQYFSPRYAQKTCPLMPCEVRRTGEVVSWLQRHACIPLGGTAADEHFLALKRLYVQHARKTIDALETQVSSIHAQKAGLIADHFLNLRQIPFAIGSGAKAP